jgi:hypothetical protein
LDTYKTGEWLVREDVKHITAEYLINNIDLSFKVWWERPWGKHIPFDAFCEEILPYRTGCEPLENWREKVLASFANLDTVLNKPETTAVEACATVNKILPRFKMDRDFSQMCFSQLMASPMGTCDNMAALTTFVMRALGIPATIDYTPHWTELPTGHSWNTVRDSAGNHISFMGTNTNPYGSHQGNTYLKPKAYRKMFSLQQNIRTEEQHVPPLLQNHKNITDVSAEHTGVADTVTVPLSDAPAVSTGYAYLALYYDDTWHPVAWAVDEGKIARFTFVGKDAVYLPVYFTDGRQIPAGEPFFLDTDGAKTLFSQNPDTLLTLDGITSSPFSHSSRMYHGVFEGAGKPDFSDARVLHTVNETPNVSGREVVLKTPVNCRYIRYKSPPDGWCNVAEIEFYGKDMQKISAGTSIGTPDAWGNTDMTCDKAYDGNMMTFFDAAIRDSAWTGLDFGERKTVCKIWYCPRSDGNYIYEKHEYELFFKTKDGWLSLGKQIAVNRDSIRYKTPSQGLFRLDNVTLNRKGDVFLLTKGRKKYF